MTVKQASIGERHYPIYSKSVLIVYIGLIALLAVNYAVNPLSLNAQNFFNLLKQASGLGICAIGQTMIILTGGIDLSSGSLITLVHVLTIGEMNGDPAMILPAILTGLAVGLLTGFVNGMGVAKAKIAPFIMTLCSDFILRGSYLIYTKGQPRGVLADSFRELGKIRIFEVIPLSVILWLFLSTLFIFILRRTVFGARVHMIGANPRCSLMSGVNNDKAIIAIYTLAGLLASIAALVLTMDMSATSLNLGSEYSMDSIAATVIGGTTFVGGVGGVEGTIAGVVLMRLVTSLLQKANIVNWAKMIIQGGIILSVVAMYSGKKKD